MKHIQNNQNPYQPMDFKKLKKKILEPKDLKTFCQMFAICIKKTIP
jgi:hypothetical protein